MTIYKKDLQSLNKDIKDLGRTIDKLIKEFDKGKKTKVTKKVTAKSTKAKTSASGQIFVNDSTTLSEPA